MHSRSRSIPRWLCLMILCACVATLSCARRDATSALDDTCGCWRQDPPWVFLATNVEPSHDIDPLKAAAPEDVGMDQGLLEEGVTALAEHVTLYSVLVLREDRLVVERYFQDEDPSRARNIQSVTKSILSALVGIAIREGYIESIDQTAASLLPSLFVAVEDARMLDITLRHLLTMTPGFPAEDPSKGLSLNLLAGIVATTLTADPGSTFDYNSISSHMVSAILAETTGMSTCAFACRYLFEPIGITVDNWSRDAKGVHVGGAALYLTPRELARFGLLTLHRGLWNEQQIVPPDWIVESTTRQICTSGSHGWDYGFYWWLTTIGGHEAIVASGYGGQTILVMPDLDLVVVMTGDCSVATEGIPITPFVRDYVIPSIRAPRQP